MNSQDKKLIVIHQLSQESELISLSQLLEKLGENFTSRSVRRWLAEMVKEGLVKKIGTRRGTKYQIALRESRNMSSTKSCFRFESTKVIEEIHKPLHERNPITYAEDWFNAYEPNVTFYIPLEFRLQLHKAGKRSKGNDPAGTYARQIFNRLLIDLSYNSSRLEGNTYSLLDTERLILEGKGAEGKLDEEKIMILNHKEAIRYLVETAHRLQICKETVCTIHFLLSDGLIETRYAGKIRDHGVRITGSQYLPFENPKKLESQLELIAEKASFIKDPYEQSFFLLIHISYLQCFSDVNKRTARLSANIPLIKNNLVPLSFNDVERDNYISAIIAVYELQDVRPLLDLYIFSYMRTCAMYDSTVKVIGFDEIRVRYRQERRALLRGIILQKLTGEEMKKYINFQSTQLVKDKNHTAFLEDVLEDIEEINESRIYGLGITQDQLKAWIQIHKKQ